VNKSLKRELIEYAYESLASELESYRVPVTYKNASWYDATRGDCDGPFWRVMRLAEACGEDFPYVVVWANGHKYFRLVPR
jgi:hypothetical protein